MRGPVKFILRHKGAPAEEVTAVIQRCFVYHVHERGQCEFAITEKGTFSRELSYPVDSEEGWVREARDLSHLLHSEAAE